VRNVTTQTLRYAGLFALLVLWALYVPYAGRAGDAHGLRMRFGLLAGGRAWWLASEFGDALDAAVEEVRDIRESCTALEEGEFRLGPELHRKLAADLSRFRSAALLEHVGTQDRVVKVVTGSRSSFRVVPVQNKLQDLKVAIVGLEGDLERMLDASLRQPSSNWIFNVTSFVYADPDPAGPPASATPSSGAEETNVSAPNETFREAGHP